MKIEVACPSADTTKAKGDLLEKLAADLLSAQNYSVIEELRVVGAELDLLCKHEVNAKQIYVECKAQSGNIGAPVLRQLLGTIVAQDYAEGWLISTAQFGKDAKGFVTEWEKKPADQASKLSFYTPERIVSALLKASVICATPKSNAEKFMGNPDLLGDWLLLVSPFGRFWAVYTLKGGAPSGVLFFSARTGELISDAETIKNLSSLETTLCDYDVYVATAATSSAPGKSDAMLPKVVEVQIGDSWNDYRPARPEDFIGRDGVQKDIFQFLDRARCSDDATKIFAITGNSGLGKSSLIAKIRDRSKNIRNAKKFFVTAIDVRGARSPAYISASLLHCLEAAQRAGFGDKIELKLTDPITPLTSPSISQYLTSVKRRGQLVSVVFDQFEELYSKPELFSVFTAAKDLMIDVASFKGAICLGFAWKTDSTTQQDHPAYYMWHDLSDHRRVFKLGVFDKGEVAKAISAFERESAIKLPVEIRHQISYSCQGFPWLLKKLCIHIYENRDNVAGADSTLLELDVGKLFESDIQSLSQPERACLKIIAENAPADWSEVIELSGVAVINSLVSKRLVIKSGDRLNVYWDIFKDFLLSGNVPVVPFNYVPTSDISSMLNVASVLLSEKYQTSETIAQKAKLKERTVWNIGADLVLFGIAERRGTEFKMHRDLVSCDQRTVLSRVRSRIDKHSLKISLFREHAGKTIDKGTVQTVLKSCLSGGTYNEKTWNIYANRFGNLLVSTGFLVPSGSKYTVQDIGGGAVELSKRSRVSEVFSALASPYSACEALKLLQEGRTLRDIMSMGYRNSAYVLRRFNLITIIDNQAQLNSSAIAKFGGVNEAIWTSAKNEAAISECILALRGSPQATGYDLGELVSKRYSLSWTPASMTRSGNGLKQWSSWIIDGADNSSIPPPPGRQKR